VKKHHIERLRLLTGELRRSACTRFPFCYVPKTPTAELQGPWAQCAVCLCAIKVCVYTYCHTLCKCAAAMGEVDTRSLLVDVRAILRKQGSATEAEHFSQVLGILCRIAQTDTGWQQYFLTSYLASLQAVFAQRGWIKHGDEDTDASRYAANIVCPLRDRGNCPMTVTPLTDMARCPKNLHCACACRLDQLKHKADLYDLCFGMLHKTCTAAHSVSEVAPLQQVSCRSSVAASLRASMALADLNRRPYTACPQLVQQQCHPSSPPPMARLST
jgi:hypothetical protein